MFDKHGAKDKLVQFFSKTVYSTACGGQQSVIFGQ